MNVSVAPELEEMIREKVESGQYGDATVVVEEALRQMPARERRIETLRAAVAVAEEDIAHGREREWTPSLRDEIMQRALAAFKAGKRPKADVCP